MYKNILFATRQSTQISFMRNKESWNWTIPQSLGVLEYWDFMIHTFRKILDYAGMHVKWVRKMVDANHTYLFTIIHSSDFMIVNGTEWEINSCLFIWMTMTEIFSRLKWMTMNESNFHSTPLIFHPMLKTSLPVAYG